MIANYSALCTLYDQPDLQYWKVRTHCITYKMYIPDVQCASFSTQGNEMYLSYMETIHDAHSCAVCAHIIHCIFIKNTNERFSFLFTVLAVYVDNTWWNSYISNMCFFIHVNLPIILGRKKYIKYTQCFICIYFPRVPVLTCYHLFVLDMAELRMAIGQC